MGKTRLALALAAQVGPQYPDGVVWVPLAAVRDSFNAVFIEGDAFDVDWGKPASFDLALVGNLCHLFDEEANLRLLQRVAEAVRPGGTVAVIDILASERGDGPRAAALYALGLVLRTARGRIYPYSAFRRWLNESGFADLCRHRLAGPFSLSLITARRR